MSYIKPDAFKIKVLVTTIDSNSYTTGVGQFASTDWEDVDGTSITYTPHPRATHVVYSACFLAKSWTTGVATPTTMHFKLQKGSTGSEADYGNNTNFNWRSVNSNVKAGTLINFEHEVPTWSGEQTLKMQFRQDSSSATGELHRSTGFVNEPGLGAVYFHPNLLVYSITK